MNSTEALVQQQSRIDSAREHYRECNRKLNHLIDQIEAADCWDVEAVASLNRQLETTGNETEAAMQVWNQAIDAIASIPQTNSYNAFKPQSYLEARGYYDDNSVMRWQPTDSVDVTVGSEEVCLVVDGDIYCHYFDTDTEF